MLKCDVNIRDDKGRPPLFYALINERKEVSDLLVRKGAKIQDVAPSVRLYLSSLHDKHRIELMTHKDLVKLLHQYGIVINTWGLTTCIKRQVFMWAGGLPASMLPITPMLLKRVLDVFLHVGVWSESKFNSLGKDGYSPLSYTLHFGSKELMSRFINHGADLQNIDGKGTSALKYATDQLKGQRRLDMLVLLAKKEHGLILMRVPFGDLKAFLRQRNIKNSEIVQLFKSPVVKKRAKFY